MASDLSRKTFDSRKHYSGVLMQQGRVQLDADWNEQLDIQQYRDQTETQDVIGKSGVPKKDNAFKISANAEGDDLLISTGRIYVGGLFCELEKYPALPSYLQQPHFKPDALQDGNYMVYIDAWQREVNYLEDESIREKALNEADTCTRLQVVWQVKLLPIAKAGTDCDGGSQEWQEFITPPSGKIKVDTEEEEPDDKPCNLSMIGGYQRSENQLYRIEIHKGGYRGQATFKWSRENGSVETSIHEIQGENTLIVEDEGRDEVLGFANNQWVEIVDEENSLNRTPQRLMKIEGIPQENTIVLDNNTNILNKNNSKLRLRRWEQSGTEAKTNGVRTKVDWIRLEGGIKVKFLPGTYRSGDFWLVPARGATGGLEWPRDDTPAADPLPQRPRGIQHHYCKLAIIQVTGNTINVRDCRPTFPTLTEISAEDIAFDSTQCHLTDAKNVQEAIDDICKRRENSCTFFVQPGWGWETIFDRIGERNNARICFQVGQYPLNRAVNITGKGHLTLVGGGPGTRIVAYKSEAALIFEDCSSVSVRDLYAQTGHLMFHDKASKKHLNGVLTFSRCKSVEIEHVKLKSGAGATRSTSCITIRNTAQSPVAVRIQNSDLQVGHRQQGILLVNASNALIENNTLNIYSKPQHLQTNKLIHHRAYRAEVRAQFLSRASIGVLADSSGQTNSRVAVAKHTVYFKTHPYLKTANAWDKLLQEHLPQRVDNDQALLSHLNKLADRLLLDQKFRDKYAVFRDFFEVLERQDAAVMAQGITIGGQVAKDIRVLNNSIMGTLQGVHVGLSHHQYLHSPSFSAGFVTISGNRIAVRLPPTIHQLERYGIFVGNCKSLMVENNNITLNRLPEAANIEIDGIRVWGKLGQRMLITKNYISSINGLASSSFHTGIHVHPLSQRLNYHQWLVSYNNAPSKSSALKLKNGVLKEANMPFMRHRDGRDRGV